MAEIRPQTRLGKHDPRKVKVVFGLIGLLAASGVAYATYHYGMTTELQIPVGRVKKGDFVISVRTRGDIKSTHSSILLAPPVPGLRILRLAKNGQVVKKGDVVVEFDTAHHGAERLYPQQRRAVGEGRGRPAGRLDRDGRGDATR